MSTPNEAISPLLKLAGMHDSEESPPLEKKSRSDLIELVKALTDMTAQQARIIESLRRKLKEQKGVSEALAERIAVTTL
jgi:hypothetical protein